MKTKKNRADQIAHLYAKFRGSPLFILVLFLMIGAWVGVHFWLGSHNDFGGLNLVLSSEASLSTALLIMDLAKGDAARKRAEERHAEQLKYMEDMMEAILATTEDIQEDLEGEEDETNIGEN